MKIILGADHGGWQMKKDVTEWLKENGYEVKDVGAVEEKKDDDYVDFAMLVAEEIQGGGEAKGGLFCKNGFGMVMAANRFTGVRCGLGFDKRAVEKGRMDDDINCLAIPSEYVDIYKAKEMISVFLKTDFSGEERYKRRLFKLASIK